MSIIAKNKNMIMIKNKKKIEIDNNNNNKTKQNKITTHKSIMVCIFFTNQTHISFPFIFCFQVYDNWFSAFGATNLLSRPDSLLLLKCWDFKFVIIVLARQDWGNTKHLISQNI